MNGVTTGPLLTWVGGEHITPDSALFAELLRLFQSVQQNNEGVQVYRSGGIETGEPGTLQAEGFVVASE